MSAIFLAALDRMWQEDIAVHITVGSGEMEVLIFLTTKRSPDSVRIHFIVHTLECSIVVTILTIPVIRDMAGGVLVSVMLGGSIGNRVSGADLRTF